MPQLLARDPSNSKRIEDLQLEENASSLVKKKPKNLFYKKGKKTCMTQPSFMILSVSSRVNNSGPRTASSKTENGVISFS